MEQNFFVAPKLTGQLQPLLESQRLRRIRRRILLIKSPYEDIVSSSKFANSFAALQGIFGYVYKFSNRIRRPTLTVSDLQGGTLRLLVLSSAHIYGMTSNHCNQNQNHQIASLSPFIDQFGLLRVDGRLRNSSLRVVEHIMADLPKERLDGSQAFKVTGIDFCGPFLYKSEMRSKPPVKCYVCVFICFATKAVHLKLIKYLSTWPQIIYLH